MVSIGPDATLPTEHAVHCLRDADGEAAHTALEARWLVRFHQQVQMIGLNAVLKKPESVGARRGEGRPNCRYGASAPEGGNGRARPERDMGGAARIEGHPSAMRHRAATRTRLPACAFAVTAPCADREVQLCRSAPHLNWADIFTN